MEIHDYQKIYEKLKNGEHVIPVSREEAFLMALIDRLSGNTSNTEEVNSNG